MIVDDGMWDGKEADLTTLETNADYANGILQAEKAAEILLDDEDDSATAVYEPSNRGEANAAVVRFGQLFAGLRGKFRKSIEAARDSGSLLSSDRLQGLSEIVQNADDAEATQVRLLLTPTALLVSHDGSPVQLHHVLGFMIPWLSTKGGDVSSIGRFGIGLTSLRSLSTTIDVHCSPYHVRIGAPSIAPIDRPTLPSGLQEEGWTTLRIPIEEGTVTPKEIEEWLDRWDDSALLFLRHVSRVTLLTPGGEATRELTLFRHDDGEAFPNEPPVTQPMSRQYAEASDGRSWVLYSTEVSSPTDSSRSHKATGDATPVSVAFPLDLVESGEVYAGLPVAPTRTALFVSAQFDPVTSRRDFADNKWNRDLVPIVAEVWSHAALDLFQRDPKMAWHAMPTSISDEGRSGWSLVGLLEEFITMRARRWLASNLSFEVPEQGLINLSKLAVEVDPLEGILTEAEIASLAGLQATLPSGVRDESGKWRTVLEDWRAAGADLPELVSVEKALDLIGDETRPVDATIALAAVALGENLGEELLRLPCVITQDGQHIVPPSRNSPGAVAAEPTLLAQQLGLVTVLHTTHLGGDEAAATVLAWLEESGALLIGSDDRAVVHRLATAGRSGFHLDSSLTDGQVQALRDAFQLMDPAERLEVGADVGRAVFLEAHTYDGKRLKTISAHPVDAYLPRRIDREPDSFAIAAEKASGPIWISEKYLEVLRSPAGRRGIGAQRFLRLLGAATAPRVRPHPQLESRFSDPRQGLRISMAGCPEARQNEMRKRGATYTLQDYISPDLETVAQDIASERRKGQRRKRSAALLATLGRAWERNLIDFAEVESAYDRFQWQSRGQINAYWLWKVGDIAWLDDESGTPRRPVELRTRTPGNVAIYGKHSPDYLHKELYQPNRQGVLRAIGVSGDPSRSELVDRLRKLRDSSGEGVATLSTSSLHAEAAIVYKALSHDLVTTTLPSDLNANQLRSEFQRGQGLLLTNLGWLPPRSVLAGPRIFRDYRAFAPQVEDAEPLWSALNLREPSPEDCLRVIHRIARKRGGPEGEDETILLETLRTLALHHRNGNSVQPRRLSRLALWTSKGWVRERPVYATDDPILAKGLRNQLPLWEPGGELEQFQPLLGLLRVERIRTANAEVIDPTHADADPESTELFQKALSLLEEDLARNDPELFEGIHVPWETLGGLEVRVHPSLMLRVHTALDGTAAQYISEVDAKVDTTLGSMFVSRSSVLPRVDGGGRALAALFEGNTRRLAQAWRAACDQAEVGIEAHRVELARQRDERERTHVEQEIRNRTSSFREATAASGGAEKATSSTRGGRRSRDAGPKAIDMGPPRTLVDPNSLEIVDPKGRIEKGAGAPHPKRSRTKRLADPAVVSAPPWNRTPIRGYSDKDKEDVGMDLVDMLLSSDRQEIVDIRTQRNVGADAIDNLKQFYELKVIAGVEPDRVILTNSEVQRAMSDDKFFLIVVSGIEGIDARPKVRVFVDPLNQLQQTYNGSITLSGVRSTESLVYDFAPADSEAALSTGEEGRQDAAAS